MKGEMEVDKKGMAFYFHVIICVGLNLRGGRNFRTAWFFIV